MSTMDVESDWELLVNSNRPSDSEHLTPVHGLDETSSGLIQPNYFSLDSQIKHTSTTDEEEEESEVSDNPSWIDPAGSENQFTMNTSGQFWSDSGSERSETRKLGEFEGIEEIISENSHLEDGCSVEVEEKPENGNVENDEKKKRSIVWWKVVPMEFVKYCAAFRVSSSPVWTFSVAAAAAVLAFVVLSRKLYKMKKKAKALDLKLTVDHKNVSQFTSRAARLNEAFSIVKRVPVIRPQLPAAGVTMWPVMSLR